MKITSATFELGAAKPAQFPEPAMPEVVFLGRSNVGKSSLLNAITGKKNLAKVSATPGKTQQINFFTINEKMRFVDLPGYGYAKASAGDRDAWMALISAYLNAERPLALILQLIDSRHPMQKNDAEVLAWMMEQQFPVQIVLTKVDKLNQKQRAKQGKELLAAIRELGCGSDLMPFSALKGIGKIELLRRIEAASESLLI